MEPLEIDQEEFNAQLKHRPIAFDLNDFLSGTAAGIAITLSGHPFDTIKVRLQTQNIINANNNSNRKLFVGGLDATVHTIQHEGFLGLYKGLTGPLLTVPLINSIVFATFEQAKRFLSGSNNNNSLSLAQITLAGGYSGLCNSFIICPIDLVKSRLQVQYEANRLNSKYQGSFHCAKQIIRNEGLYKFLSTGMLATICREIPAYAAQFYVYEATKRSAINHYTKKQIVNNSNSSEFTPILPVSVQLMCGGIAGIACWLASYPQDLIKSRLQVQTTKHYTGIIDCYKKTISKDGVRGLWVGFGPTVARAFVANAVGFFVYELAVDLLKKWRPN